MLMITRRDFDSSILSCLPSIKTHVIPLTFDLSSGNMNDEKVDNHQKFDDLNIITQRIYIKLGYYVNLRGDF